MTTKLDRETVVGAALQLLNEVGIDGLTTRKLAEKLEVQQPALYWHFQNKRALLDALAAAMLAKKHKRSRPEKGEDWRVFLKENARSFRKALLSYRDGARVHVGSMPPADENGTAEIQIQFLCEAGFSPREAMLALIAISHYVVGAVLEQQAPRSKPSSSKPSSVLLQTLFSEYKAGGEEAAFEYGLESLILGLRQ
nr:Tetracyclin repressor, C-terminal all-alpha domain protein [uncultured bacterium]